MKVFDLNAVTTSVQQYHELYPMPPVKCTQYPYRMPPAGPCLSNPHPVMYEGYFPANRSYPITPLNARVSNQER